MSFIPSPIIITLSIIILLKSILASNFPVVINTKGVKNKNICNLEYMKSLLPEIETKSKRIAWEAEPELLEICPNNTYTCCNSEEINRLAEYFKQTRDLLLFKNQLLQKLFSFLNSVARESFESFKNGFTEKEIQCAGKREYDRLQIYYNFIVSNAAEVNRNVEQNTQKLIELYSSFLCASCSPINELLFSINTKTKRPIVYLNKRTCETVVELSYNRITEKILWNRINKIINAIKCKGGIQNELILETFTEVLDSYNQHDECLQEDYNFVNDPKCAQLCKEKLQFFNFTGYRLNRIKYALEALHQTFNLKSKTDYGLVQILKAEDKKHPNEFVKQHIEKFNSIQDKSVSTFLNYFKNTI